MVRSFCALSSRGTSTSARLVRTARNSKWQASCRGAKAHPNTWDCWLRTAATRAGEIDVCIDAFEVRQVASTASTAEQVAETASPDTPADDSQMDELAAELDEAETDAGAEAAEMSPATEESAAVPAQQIAGAHEFRSGTARSIDARREMAADT